MRKKLLFDAAAREGVLRGATLLASAVRVTLGPKSKCVLIDRKWGEPIVCNDGVTIAKELEVDDPTENLGIRMIREAAERTRPRGGGLVRGRRAHRPRDPRARPLRPHAPDRVELGRRGRGRRRAHARRVGESFGFDAARGTYVDLVEAGIVDPTKVVRIALESAVSVASVLLLTEATFVELPAPKAEAPPPEL